MNVPKMGMKNFSHGPNNVTINDQNKIKALTKSCTKPGGVNPLLHKGKKSFTEINIRERNCFDKCFRKK